MKECAEDWLTCGHCLVGSYSNPYPACDKEGILSSVTGDDICPNAPFTDDSGTVKEA